MTQAEFDLQMEALEKVRVKYTRTKRAARKFLRDAGIILEEKVKNETKGINRKKRNQ